jgi:hypothetical protein
LLCFRVLALNFDDLILMVQSHFTDGLVLVVGSGLSLAEGIPGMGDLARHLTNASKSLGAADASSWKPIQAALDRREGLEAALLANAPTPSLELWIIKETCELLLPIERAVIGDVLHGRKSLRLTKFLQNVLKPASGLPILTTNYDRLVEVACEMAGFHVDSSAIGVYAGGFDHLRSCWGSARGITNARPQRIEHYPRAVVLKPHGSFDWYLCGDEPRRCSVDVGGDRLIITPGLNKYKAGYGSPFDKHRDLGNDHINRAARFLVLGYGFNDDHLQVHLRKKIMQGIPTLILNRSINANVQELVNNAPSCVCLSKPAGSAGTVLNSKTGVATRDDFNLWDIEILTKELLS